MEGKNRLFINYCLKKKLLSQERLKEIIKENSDDPQNIISCIAEELGWSDTKLRRLIKTLDKHETNRSTEVSSETAVGLDSEVQTLEGRKLGNYLIQKEIASGGMGRIYKGYNPQLERTVAIKVRIGNETFKDEDRERFLREARLSAQLDHPNIIRVYDVGIEGDLCYIVMDYIQGETLEAWVKKRPKPLWVVKHMATIAEALYYAHSKMIIHRDIKPSNIMIEKEENPIVMDFGIARRIGDKDGKVTHTGQIIGSPQYMSPEQARAEKVDVRTDIYSLGATFYELLTGKPVVNAENVMVMLYQIINLDPVPISDVVPSLSKDIQTICMKCLEKDPKNRYQSMDDLSKDLKLFMSGEGITAKPPGSLTLLGRWGRRHKYISMLALLIVIVAVFLGAGFPVYEKHLKKEQVINLLSEGENKFKSLDYKGAEMSFQKVLLLEQNQEAKDGIDRVDKGIEALLIKADVYAAQGKWEDAELIYDNILKNIYPYHPKTKEEHQKLLRNWATTYYHQAMDLTLNPNVKRSDLLEAIDLLIKSVNIDPTFIEAYYQRARIYHRISHLKNALEDYRNCLILNSNFLPARYYLHKIQVENKYKENESDSNLPKIKEIFQEQFELLLKAYSLYYGEHSLDKSKRNYENYGEALKICTQIEKDFRSFSEVHFLKATIYEDLSFHPKIRTGSDETEKTEDCSQSVKNAFDSVNKCLELDPSNGGGYFLRGNIYLTLHNFSYALQDYEKALDLGFADTLLYYNRAVCLINEKNYNEAERSILISVSNADIAENFKPEDKINLHYFLYSFYFLTEEYDRAEKEINEFEKLWMDAYGDENNNKRYQNEEYEMFPIVAEFLKLMLYCLQNKEEKTIIALNKSKDRMERVNWVKDFVKYSHISPDMWSESLKTFVKPFVSSPNYKIFLKEFNKTVYSSIYNIPYLRNFFSYTYLNLIHLLPLIFDKIKNDQRAYELISKLSDKLNLKFRAFDIMYCVWVAFMCLEEPRFLDLDEPLSAEFYYRRAGIRYRQGDFEKALTDLEDALDLNSNDMELNYAMATVSSCLVKKASDDKETKFYKEKALYHLKRAIELGWKNIDYTRKDIDFSALFNAPVFNDILNNTKIENNLEDIINNAKSVLREKNARSVIQRLKPYKDTNNKELLEIYFKAQNNLCSDMSKNAEEIINKKEGDKKDKKDAITKILNEAYQLLSTYGQKRLKRYIADCYINIGDQKKASDYVGVKLIEDYEEALKYDSQCWQAYERIGDYYKAQGDIERAVLNWDEALIFCYDKDSSHRIDRKKKDVPNIGVKHNH